MDKKKPGKKESRPSESLCQDSTPKVINKIHQGWKNILSWVEGWLRKRNQREGINRADIYDPSFCTFDIPRTVKRGLQSHIKFLRVNKREDTIARLPSQYRQQKLQETRIVPRRPKENVP